MKEQTKEKLQYLFKGFIILLISVIILAFGFSVAMLCDWDDLISDKVCTQMSATYISKYEETTVSMVGTVSVTHRHYYVKVQVEDGTITDIEDKPLYDRTPEQSEINLYKIEKYKDGKLISTEYSMTDIER